jgi:hypothetical protein
LIPDEIRYPPINKASAGPLYHLLAQRYERAPKVLTMIRGSKDWVQGVKSDATMRAASPDVSQHRVQIVIEGPKPPLTPGAHRNSPVPKPTGGRNAVLLPLGVGSGMVLTLEIEAPPCVVHLCIRAPIPKRPELWYNPPGIS